MEYINQIKINGAKIWHTFFYKLLQNKTIGKKTRQFGSRL